MDFGKSAQAIIHYYFQEKVRVAVQCFSRFFSNVWILRFGLKVQL